MKVLTPWKLHKKWYVKPTNDICFCKKYGLREQWSSDIAVSHTLTKHSGIQGENTRFKICFSPLTRLSINVADSSLLPLLVHWALCQAVLLLTTVVATKIGSREFYPWHIMHILGFITLTSYLSVLWLSQLAIFWVWISMGVSISNYLTSIQIRHMVTLFEFSVKVLP